MPAQTKNTHWSPREDLNPQPTVYKTVALPVELRGHKNGAGGGIRTPEGIKPTDLQSVAFDRFATPAYFGMEPKPRIELGTSSLPWKRSTTELFGQMFLEP